MPIFRSDAAIRGGYGWNELCETEKKLPSLEEQRKSSSIQDNYRQN